MILDEEGIYHVFQPVYNIQTSKICGFEGLLRSKNEPNPEIFFKKAKMAGLLKELDVFSINKALINYYSTEENLENLYLNIYPSTILSSNFSMFLKFIVSSLNIPKDQIVFELLEDETIDDFRLLQSRIYEIKALGFKVAIDDFGKGFANLERVIELEPDIVKLDRYFAKDIQTFKKKQTMIQLLLEYFNKIHCEVILEGIETEEVLNIARKLGIKYAQGFYLGKPAALSEYLQYHSV